VLPAPPTEIELKIHSTPTPTPLPAGAPAPRPEAGGNAAATGRAAEGSAQVALSSMSRRLLELQNGESDIDLERVAALREAIAAGKLPIDPDRIADGLIASARELLK